MLSKLITPAYAAYIDHIALSVIILGARATPRRKQQQTLVSLLLSSSSVGLSFDDPFTACIA